MSIVWLASYPKSGNTWLRAQLTAWQNDDGKVPDLCNLDGTPLNDHRDLMDDHCGISTSELTAAELDRLRPDFFTTVAAELDDPTFVKTHAAYRFNDLGQPVFPADGCRGVVYVIRNPVDIVPSFAHHLDRDFDRIIDLMTDEDMVLGQVRDGFGAILPERVSSWASHVRGWTTQTTLPLLLVRYEDMLADPVGELTRVIRFAGLNDDPARIRRATEETGFQSLRQQEQTDGAAIQPLAGGSFFRCGTSGDGTRHLASRQVDRLLQHGSTTFEAFGYDMPGADLNKFASAN